METMRLLIPILLLCASSCQVPKQSQNQTFGLYESDDSSQILVTDGKRSYFGTRYTPENIDILRTFGSPVSEISSDGSRCTIVSGLTFAVPEKRDFECGGASFQRIQYSGKEIIVRVSCYATNGRRCIPSVLKSNPLLEYDFAYVPDKGVEWIRLPSNESDGRGGYLRYRSGIRILGLG